MNSYLNGIEWDAFEGIPDIFVTRHHLNGWRYFATYKNGNLHKPVIFKKLADGGMDEVPKTWDWHHVVEGVHLKPLFSPSDYVRLYAGEWPTVLVHSDGEHKVLNSLFRSKGTSEGLPKAGAEPLSGSERSAYINTLHRRYQDIYLGDPVLRKVAHNLTIRLS